ncbi:MAG TPA: lipase maturation factor family protein [Vicinamibacterales bacterium]|nr:lipase maturation factor family protein [Vicinamibacterales bacterium]
MPHELPAYWYSRWLFERGLALTYLIGFLVVVNQFIPLLGERGLLPVARFVRQVPFRASPSLFFFASSDNAFRIAGWAGVVLSCVALTGIAQHRSAIAAAIVWGLLWVLYLSFVNVGQTWYAFGWESLLCEAGFFTIFAGATGTAPPALLNWIYRWTLFRLMFGAGLIKIRGDACWRNLTCLDYFFETQPIPNPLSWYLHHLPRPILHGGVAFNHFVELIVPFGFFLPQPYAGIAGLFTIAFQLVLIVGGNLSWLNWLTIVLAFTTLDDRFLSWLPVSMPTLGAMPVVQRVAVAALAVLVALLSVGPVRNMLSPNQVMNTSFNSLQIVNTYGAFGSVTRQRYEIAIEGSDDPVITGTTTWREYQFKGKPGDPARMPSQIAPYHLRLDWLMWFAAMGSAQDSPWFTGLLAKLLEGDPGTLGLLRGNPFPDHPPRWIRAQLYLYRFTTPEERNATGQWWHRTLVGPYFPPSRLPERNPRATRH